MARPYTKRAKPEPELASEPACFDHDQCMYRGMEPRIFRKGEAVPAASEGWLDHQTPSGETDDG